VVAGVLLAVVAVCAVLAVSSFSGLANKVSGFQRMPVPGQRVLTFSSPGSYLIYFEGPGFAGLRSTATVQVGIQSESSHQQVKLTALNGKSENYRVGSHSGLAVASFTITTPGRYLMNAGQPNGSPVPADIAIGPDIIRSLVVGVVGIIAGILALICSVVAWLVTLLLRSRSRRRLLGVGSVGPLPAAPYGMQFGGAPAQQPPYGQYPGPVAPPGQYPAPSGQSPYPGQTAPPVQYPGPPVPPAPGSQPPVTQ
jgi:hypothetical protein